ncbi:MAG: flavodoxin-dependent (E)-4-hydroxy-3-methylbut-2-enyl-diphosphate synthase [Desulfovibrio sp.]|jgi:(E)-4-hydroxy-3-methylbut-2-enyl-diphosphate synthase|nr:flavodoxin-dependent (E)-4-hydroxy-3-methylbut-2-enyl-diphosphate synthase [Desulfovibrio sp.]
MRASAALCIGGVQVGGGAPVVVQSMTDTDTRDSGATLAQIAELAAAGCELARVAVPDDRAAAALRAVCASSPLPVIADIHFSSRLAVAALEAGAAALRINPGNIGGPAKTRRVADAAKAHGASIRIGVNSGSLEKALLERYGGPTAEALVESALNHAILLERCGFSAVKLSMKSSDVPTTVAAYRLAARRCPHPLHVGITEAGTLLRGLVKSAAGIGILLSEGIGDTIRISLTHNPVREVEAAWRLLSALKLRQRGPEIIACPTCGRTEIDLVGLAEAVEEELRGVTEYFTVAVMGCVVNGPGEAREADVGIAGGSGKGIVFRKGVVVRSASGGRQELLRALCGEIAVLRREIQSDNAR